MSENICQECGMTVKTPAEYHPFEACILFKHGHNGDNVRASLERIGEHFVRPTDEKSVFDLLKESAETYLELCPNGYTGSPVANRYSTLTVFSGETEIQLSIGGSHAGFYENERELVKGLAFRVEAMRRNIAEQKLKKAQAEWNK